MEVQASNIATARELMPHLNPRGVWFNGLTAGSVDEAEAFLEELRAWAEPFAAG